MHACIMQKHMHKCLHKHTLKNSVSVPRKNMETNSTRVCSTFSAETTPPSHRRVLPAGKKLDPKNSLVKKNEAEFSHTLWPRVYVSTGALSPPVVGTESDCRSSGSAMGMTLQWQSLCSPKMGQ